MICRYINPWKVSPKEAIAIQNKLRLKIDRLAKKDFHLKINRIAAADVSFFKSSSQARAVILAFAFPNLKLIEKVMILSDVNFPYVPGLLSFREGPILIKAFKRLESDVDLILFDGQGICHPRRLGIATHMGIILDKPTIGCAKTHLYGDFKEPKIKRGFFSLIKDKKNNEIIAVALRTKDNVRPIFVSVGYKIDLESAIEIVLSISRYRIPEPLRLAHHCSKTGNLNN